MDFNVDATSEVFIYRFTLSLLGILTRISLRK